VPRYRYTTPTGEVRIIEAESPEAAMRQTRGGTPAGPPPTPPPTPAPLPPPAAAARTDVALDPEGRVLTAPFQAAAQREALPLGVAGETGRQFVSTMTGLPMGGETKFDPLTLGLNVLSLAPPLAVARVVPPAVRAAASLVAPAAQTATRRVATGAAIGALEAATPKVAEGAPPSEWGPEAFTGAVSGAVRTVPGELVGAGGKRVVQRFGAGRVKRLAKEETYKAIEDAAPWVTTEMREGVTQRVPIRTDADVHRLFVRGDAFKNLGDSYERGIGEVVDVAKNPEIVVPTLLARRKAPAGTTIPLREAFAEVSKLGKLAYRGGVDTPAKQAAREAHRAMMGEIEEALGSLPNGDLALGLYQQTRQQYREGLAMTTFLQKVPRLTEGGQVNIQAIRTAAENAKQAIDLAKRHPEGLDKLIEAVNRGAGPLVGAERTGLPPSVTISPSVGRGGMVPGLTISPGQAPVVPGWEPLSPAQRAYADVLVQAARRAATGEPTGE
jgi:hypothetical protein